MESLKCTDRVIEQIIYCVIGCDGGDCIFYLDIETTHGWHIEILNSPFRGPSSPRKRLERIQDHLFGQTQVVFQSGILDEVKHWVNEQNRMDWFMQFRSGLKVLSTLPYQVGDVL